MMIKLNTVALAVSGLLLTVPAALAVPPPPEIRPAITAEPQLSAPAAQRLVHTLCQLGGIYRIRCLSYSGRPANSVFTFDSARRDD